MMMSCDETVVVSLDSHVAMQRKRAVLTLHPLAGDRAQYRLAAALDQAKKIGREGVAPPRLPPRRPGLVGRLLKSGKIFPGLF